MGEVKGTCSTFSCQCFLTVDQKKQTLLGQRQERTVKRGVLTWEAGLCSAARAYLFNITCKLAKTQPWF